MKYNNLSKKYKRELIERFESWEEMHEVENKSTIDELEEQIIEQDEDYLIVLDEFNRESLITQEEWNNDEDNYYIKIIGE